MASSSLSTIINPSLSVTNTLSPVFNTMSQSINVCRINLINMQQVTDKGVDTSSITAAQADVGGLADKLLNVASKAKQGILSVVALSDSMAQTATKVNFMNAGLDETDNIQKKILNSAQASNVSFQDTANLVASLGINAKDAFSSSDEVIGFAELVSKQFAIAGASSGEATGALSQLSQAMGDGVISGDELNSIFAQTPNVIQDIADYLGVSVEKVTEMGANGELTADMLKGAMFAASSDINNQFATIPMTWSDITTKIKNSALGAFAPILTKINEIANSEGVQSLANGMINGLSLVGSVATELFDILVTTGSFLYDNWDLISPVIYGVAAALGFFTVVLAAHNIVQGIHATLTAASELQDSIYAAKIRMTTGATFAQTAAQVGLNAALLACPLTWIVIAIIAVIAAIYLIVAAINHLTGSSISATGVIIGAVLTAGAFILNTIIGLINGMIQIIWSLFVEPYIGIIEWVLNAATGGFNSFGDAVANLIGQIISWFLSLGKIVTKIIDAMFGTDWTTQLSSLQDSMLAWGKNENAITLNHTAPSIDFRAEYGDAYNTGYKLGEGIDSKVSGLFDSTSEDTLTDQEATTESAVNSLANIDNNTASGAESSERVADSVEITDEDLKYLRDIAEREIIDRTVFKSLSVNMGGISNTVNNMGDLDGIADYLGDVISQTASASMEGVG